MTLQRGNRPYYLPLNLRKLWSDTWGIVLSHLFPESHVLLCDYCDCGKRLEQYVSFESVEDDKDGGPLMGQADTQTGDVFLYLPAIWNVSGKLKPFVETFADVVQHEILHVLCAKEETTGEQQEWAMEKMQTMEEMKKDILAFEEVHPNWAKDDFRPGNHINLPESIRLG